MDLNISNDEFDLISKYIEKQCGIAVGQGKQYLIESRLSSLVIESGCKTFGEFYLRVVNDASQSLRDKIVDAITTNETSWFRDHSPYTIFSEVILPDYFAQLESGKKVKVRIWSAACSTGQEPYSLAMLIQDYLQKHPGTNVKPQQFEILGTDISPSALMLAIGGRYDQISISRGMEDAFKARYFKPLGRVWALDDTIKRMVIYKKFNLQNNFTALGIFDIIFCRNVAIYFSDEFKRDLFARLHRALAPNGYFFLGSAESISGYSAAFELKDYKRAIYYRPKQG